MKHFLAARGRLLALGGVLLPLAALLIYTGLRSGPLAPVPVTVATVASGSITPALFGIGTVQARYTFKIGPTVAGRVKSVAAQVGDRVAAGQIIAEMDPVDLDDRIAALDAAIRRAEAAALAAEAQIQEVGARKAFAEAQASRYEKLRAAQAVSAEALEARRQEVQVAEAGMRAARANFTAARQEPSRLAAERDGLTRQRANLRLVAPATGLVGARLADPGTTLVAGQAVLEVFDPASVWVDARFDQSRAAGLTAGLRAGIAPRGMDGRSLPGRVARIEPLADAVTEEAVAKVVFDKLPTPPPAIGELAEVTVALAPLPARPVLANASIQRLDGRLGVWVVEDDRLRFAPVKLGAADLDGRVQVLDGLSGGERVVVHSHKALTANSRFKIVDSVVGATR